MENSDIEAKKDDKAVKPQRKYEKQPLSIREKGFIKAYTEIGAETYGLAQEAAIKAGFTKALIGHTARRLMANPKILIAIDEVYAERMKGTPSNVARIMSNLDNTESLALKLKSMPTLTKVNELRGKYLDIWASTNSGIEDDTPLQLSQDDADKIKLIHTLMQEDLPSIVEYLKAKRERTLAEIRTQRKPQQ